MKYLITGITGTLGQEVSRQLLADPGNVVIGISRDEFMQQLTPKHNRLTLLIADIRDGPRISDIVWTYKPDLIFHFAALKHVDIAEKNPYEAIFTNIQGTHNVVSAQKRHGVPRLVMSTTDKAVAPINVYGHTKALAERLVLSGSHNNMICRYGNVLASRGSVVESMVKSIRSEKRVYITDPNMTRFFLTIGDAARFVIASAGHPIDDGWRSASRCGEQIPKDMKAASISEIASAVIAAVGGKDIEVVTVGNRGGEKIHEDLHENCEGYYTSRDAPRHTREELISMIEPIVRKLI